MAGANQSEPLPLPWHLPQRHNQDLFTAALQDLRDLRPLLHSAAEYYETAYFHSSQKKMVIQSLQDYCAKVLVNSVDHLGTVGSHLDECLSRLAVEISNVDLQMACITARLSACREKTVREGLTQSQQMRSRKPVYLKHYDSEVMISGKHFLSLPQLSPGKLEEIFQANAGSDSSTLKSLSWYLAFESSSSATSKRLQGAKRSTSLGGKSNSFIDQAHFVRSLSSGQTPRCRQTFNPSVKVFSSNSNSLGSLMMMDVEHKQETTISKLPLISLFGKAKGVKSNFFDLR